MIAPRPANLAKTWRAQGVDTEDRHKGTSPFDEVVVGDWLHAEVMDTGSVWIRVGPLRLWVRKHGERFSIHVWREPSERRYRVMVNGDITQDFAIDDDLAHRALLAYEVARRWDRKVAPDAKRLARQVRSLVGPLLQDRSRRDR